MCNQEKRRKENGLTDGVLIDFMTGVLMTECLVIGWGREILFIDRIHPVLLPDILIDKDSREVMVVSADIPADRGFGPGLVPFRVPGETEKEPEDGDEV